MNKRNTFLLMSLLMVIGLISGGTFAYWTWYSPENKSVVFNTAGNVSDYIVYDEGTSHFVGDFKATSTYCQGVNTTLSFYKKSEAADIDFRATIYMDINAIGSNIAASDDVYWVVTNGYNTVTCSSGLNGTEVVASGTFNGKTMGESISLVSDIVVTTSIQKYTVWIWLNSSGNPSSALSGDTIDTNVWTRIDMVDPEGGTNIDNSGDTYTISFDANGGEISTLYTEPGEHVYTVPSTGTYKLEVWGAQGGTGVVNGSSKYEGGYGGYSVGRMLLQSGTTLYANVGGKGEDAQDKQAGGVGGYNGGGTGGIDSNYSSSGSNEPGAGGGGASHIAFTSGVLLSLENNKDSIIIVAGGGGGGSYYGAGSSGGGMSGNGYTADNGSSVPGTQTSGYAFGVGEDGVSFNSGQGGAGSGYYGGGSGTPSGGIPGAGGSGYIGNSLLTNKVMYCYNCTISGEYNTLTNTTTKVSSTPVSNYAKIGDGAIKITKVNDDKKVTNGSAYGTLPTPTREGYIFKGWNTRSDGFGDTIGENSIVSLSSNATLYAIWQRRISFVNAIPDGYSDYLHMGLTVPGLTAGAAGWVKVYYTATYDPITNQSTITFNTGTGNGNHRLAAAQSDRTVNFTCTTDVTITSDGGYSSMTATMEVKGSLTGQGVWTYFKAIPEPQPVVIQHSDVLENKTITIKTKTKHTYDYVATGSNEVTITVANPE